MENGAVERLMPKQGGGFGSDWPRRLPPFEELEKMPSSQKEAIISQVTECMSRRTKLANIKEKKAYCDEQVDRQAFICKYCLALPDTKGVSI